MKIILTILVAGLIGLYLFVGLGILIDLTIRESKHWEKNVSLLFKIKFFIGGWYIIFIWGLFAYWIIAEDLKMKKLQKTHPHLKKNLDKKK